MHLGAAIKDGVEIVYHLAALVGVDHYIRRPIDVIDVNVFGTKNVLELAGRAGAKVVVASTSEVFGKNPAVPWSENADRVLGSTATDRWSYSSSKAVAEHLTFAFIRQRGLRASIVRYFNLYGPRQRPAFVLSRSIHRALRGLAPVVYDDGRQTRSFTYVGDVIDATVQAAEGGFRLEGDGPAIDIPARHAPARPAASTPDTDRRTPPRGAPAERLSPAIETGATSTVTSEKRSPGSRSLPSADDGAATIEGVPAFALLSNRFTTSGTPADSC